MLYPAQFEDCLGVECFKGSIIVTFRDVPEAITQGDTFEDAVDMAQECLSLVLFGYEEEGSPRPKPSAPRHGDVMIEVKL